MLWVFAAGLLHGPLKTVQLRQDEGHGRIRCPKCGWEPSRDDRWSCGPDGCGHVWNTFDTRGRCPSCDRHWQDTCCLRCGQWSDHESWYEPAREEE